MPNSRAKINPWDIMKKVAEGSEPLKLKEPPSQLKLLREMNGTLPDLSQVGELLVELGILWPYQLTTWKRYIHDDRRNNPYF